MPRLGSPVRVRFPALGGDSVRSRPSPPFSWRRSQVARQWTANPLTAVRIRPAPLQNGWSQEGPAVLYMVVGWIEPKVRAEGDDQVGFFLTSNPPRDERGRRGQLTRVGRPRVSPGDFSGGINCARSSIRPPPWSALPSTTLMEISLHDIIDHERCPAKNPPGHLRETDQGRSSVVEDRSSGEGAGW